MIDENRIFQKNEHKKIIKQQSKLTFNGIHKSYENSDSYNFVYNEVLMDDKTIYVGFAVLELSKLHMYESYDKLQPYFGQENIQCHSMDTDSFVLSLKRKYYYRKNY